ncbi:MAG TPA: InlB B-repeat-containing protein, partial [Spirochaetota bacterium]|nr:InlB B-repeat-containing protein [Spirochaetota bacterium]
MVRKFLGLALLAWLAFGCYNSNLDYSIPEDSELLNSGSDMTNGVRGSVKIPGMNDASNCLVVVERQIDGLRTASVYETTNRGISDYDLLFGGIFSVYTDKNGKFEIIGMPEGTYTVTVKKENTLGAVVKDVVVKNDRAIVDLDIVLTATGRITGRVTLSDMTTDMYGSFVYAEGTSYIAATDISGDFCIKDIPIGTYNLVFYHEGYATRILNDVTVDAAVDNPVGSKSLSKISKNVYLSGLTISKGTMSPAFDKNVTYYDVTVDGTVNTVTFTPSAENSNSTIKINGAIAESGAASENMSVDSGKNIFSIDVISESGEIRNYIVVVEKIITTKYTVTFESNGGSAVANQSIVSGNKIVKPANPTTAIAGYTFGGWHIDSSLKNEWLFNLYTVSENITLYAKWNAITYNISYNLDGGTNKAGNPAIYTVETPTIILQAPTKSCYTFGGWYSDPGFATKITEITLGSTGDVELWAKWNSDFDIISCGNGHTVAIKSNGTLWAWGANGSGQLGDGTTANKLLPVQIGSSNNWVSVSCGNGHTVAIKSNGSLWAWGNNQYGQLGDGTTTNRSSPVQIGGGSTDWASVSCGQYHTVAIKSNGSLWAWGFNNSGQLGDETTANKSSPVQIGVSMDWASVSCGQYHTVAIKSNGSLWAWGRNNSGQLGDGTTTNKSSPVQIGGGSTDWAGVSCGGSHTVAIKSNGTLWAWGYNQYGQLGDGTTASRSSPVQIGSSNNWVSVSCGGSHTVAIKSNGTLWAWGNNQSGQLGDGTMVDKSSPIQIGVSTDWASVSCGGGHTVAIKSNGSLWAWGSNYYGQLGDGTTANKFSPVQIGVSTDWASVSCGTYHTVAIKSNGTLWAWGFNNSGQLGDGTMVDKSSPIQIGVSTDWASVSCGGGHTVAIK